MASAQMSLGKSAWQAPSNNVKVLKTGGAHQAPKGKYDKSVSLFPKESAEQGTKHTAAIDTQPRTHTITWKATSARDHLNLWGDVQAIETDQIDFSTESLNPDFDSLSAVDSLVMAGSNNFDSLDTFWNAADEPIFIAGPSENALEAPSDDYDVEMMLVDPRAVGGFDAAIAETAVPINEESPFDGFDLLEFVMDSTISADAPAFRNHIGDDTLFVEDITDNLVLSTIDPGQLDFLTVSEPAPEIKPEVSEAQSDVEEEAAQPVAKRPRGRPRVPRTCSLKPITNSRRQRASPNVSNSPSSPGSCASYSNDDKYRRMRDLNNVASKRCRQNRKMKLQAMEEILSKEGERNTDLQMKVRLLEEQVKRVKDAIFKSIVTVANPRVRIASPAVDIEELIRQKAAEML